MIAELSHRAVVCVKGKDGESFLQGLITNDVRKLSENKALYAALLTPQGRFQHDLFLIKVNDEELWLDCERERSHQLIQRLSLYRLRAQIDFTLSTHKVYARWNVQKPVEDEVKGNNAASIIVSDPRLPNLGDRLYGDHTSTNLSSFEDYDLHRLSLGVPDGSRDIPVDKGIILECRFDEFEAISWDKGCYLGQELIARTRYQGMVRKRLFPIFIEGEPPASFSPLFFEGQEVGDIRSYVRDRGLAMIRLDAVAYKKFSCGETTVHLG